MTAQNNAMEAELNKYLPVFRDYPFLTEKRHECPADRADVEFIFEQLNKVPDLLKRLSSEMLLS